jgi:hypothetical protein
MDIIPDNHVLENDELLFKLTIYNSKHEDLKNLKINGFI